MNDEWTNECFTVKSEYNPPHVAQTIKSRQLPVTYNVQLYYSQEHLLISSLIIIKNT